MGKGARTGEGLAIFSIGASIVIMLLTAILFMIFLILRLDKHVSWNWLFVFIPLWIFILSYLILVFAVFYLLYFEIRRHTLEGTAWLISIGVLFLLFSILLALKVQKINGDFIYWALVFIPLWIGLALLLVIDETWGGDYRTYEYEADYRYRSAYGNSYWRGVNVLPQNVLVCVTIFTILLVLKLDGVITRSWAIIFLPLWFIDLLVVLLLLASILDAYVNWSYDIYWIALGFIPILASEIVLVLKLDTIISTQWAIVFIPFWFSAFVALIGSCIWCCCLIF